MQEHLHFLYLVIVWALFAVFFDGLPPTPLFLCDYCYSHDDLTLQGSSDNQRVGRHFQLGELEWDRKHGRPAWCASMLASIQIPHSPPSHPPKWPHSVPQLPMGHILSRDIPTNTGSSLQMFLCLLILIIK